MNLADLQSYIPAAVGGAMDMMGFEDSSEWVDGEKREFGRAELEFFVIRTLFIAFLLHKTVENPTSIPPSWNPFLTTPPWLLGGK